MHASCSPRSTPSATAHRALITTKVDATMNVMHLTCRPMSARRHTAVRCIENGGAMAADDSAAAPAEPELKAGSMATGAGFRAVVTRGDSVVWSCNHVHFTDHSAKADAQAHLATMQPDEASAVASVAAPAP
jgi:hypothetical protein